MASSRFTWRRVKHAVRWRHLLMAHVQFCGGPLDGATGTIIEVIEALGAVEVCLDKQYGCGCDNLHVVLVNRLDMLRKV